MMFASLSPRWARVALCSTALTSALLAACGGGGGSSASGGSGTAATAAYTMGSISGFGSIIVNGVRFDDSQATVIDDEGGHHGRDDLGLGASVEIESGPIDAATQTAVATVIRYGSELKGPVTAVDSGQARMTLLGQTVEVAGTTVFGAGLSGGLAAVQAGQLLEVHGLYDAARQLYVASRVDLEDSTSHYKLRGPVVALDTSARTLRLGAATIRYGAVASVPAGLATGQWVRVKLNTTANDDGSWNAVELRSNERKPSQDHAEAEVKGGITAWTSATSFSVNDLPVDASSASFPDGQSGVVLGAQVEVKGSVVNGVLVATTVHLESEQEHPEGEDFELHGTVSALDTTARSFVLRGVTVHYDDTTQWRGLTEAQLAGTLRIEVKGSLSADGTTLQATRISADD